MASYTRTSPAYWKKIRALDFSKEIFLETRKKGIVVPTPKTNPPQTNKMRTVTLIQAPPKNRGKHDSKKSAEWNRLSMHIGKTCRLLMHFFTFMTLLLASTITRKKQVWQFSFFKRVLDKVDHMIFQLEIFKNYHTSFGWWLKIYYLMGRTIRVKIY